MGDEGDSHWGVGAVGSVPIQTRIGSVPLSEPLITPSSVILGYRNPG